VRKLDLAKPLVAVTTRARSAKRDMKNNDFLPRIDVDPETYEVRADGELLTCEPASVLPMAQRYLPLLSPDELSESASDARRSARTTGRRRAPHGSR
jgi:hypothetical protein